MANEELKQLVQSTYQSSLDSGSSRYEAYQAAQKAENAYKSGTSSGSSSSGTATSLKDAMKASGASETQSQWLSVKGSSGSGRVATSNYEVKNGVIQLTDSAKSAINKYNSQQLENAWNTYLSSYLSDNGSDRTSRYSATTNLGTNMKQYATVERYKTAVKLKEIQSQLDELYSQRDEAKFAFDEEEGGANGGTLISINNQIKELEEQQKEYQLDNDAANNYFGQLEAEEQSEAEKKEMEELRETYKSNGIDGQTWYNQAKAAADKADSDLQAAYKELHNGDIYYHGDVIGSTNMDEATKQELQKKYEEALAEKQKADKLLSWASNYRYSDLDTSNSAVQAGRDIFADTHEAQGDLDDSIATQIGLDLFPAMAAQYYKENTAYKEPTSDWTEEQHRIYYALLAQGNTDEADEYATNLNNQIQTAKNQAKANDYSTKATDNLWSGTWRSAVATAAGLGSGVEYLNDVIEYANRGTVTEKAFGLADYNQAVTDSISSYLNTTYGTVSGDGVFAGKGLGDVYQVAQSIGQSWAAMALTGGSSALVNVMFFGQAAKTTLDEQLTNGTTPGKAVAMGALAGVAEVLGETVSLENIKSLQTGKTKGLLMDILISAGIEGSEEGFTTLINTCADALVMGNDSDFYVSLSSYISQGMDYMDAYKQALKDWTKGIFFDVLGGAISGGVSAGVAAPAYRAANSLKQFNGDSEGLLRTAASFGGNTKSASLAATYQQRIDKAIAKENSAEQISKEEKKAAVKEAREAEAAKYGRTAKEAAAIHSGTATTQAKAETKNAESTDTAKASSTTSEKAGSKSSTKSKSKTNLKVYQANKLTKAIIKDTEAQNKKTVQAAINEQLKAKGVKGNTDEVAAAIFKSASGKILKENEIQLVKNTAGAKSIRTELAKYMTNGQLDSEKTKADGTPNWIRSIKQRSGFGDAILAAYPGVKFKGTDVTVGDTKGTLIGIDNEDGKNVVVIQNEDSTVSTVSLDDALDSEGVPADVKEMLSAVDGFGEYASAVYAAYTPNMLIDEYISKMDKAINAVSTNVSSKETFDKSSTVKELNAEQREIAWKAGQAKRDVRQSNNAKKDEARKAGSTRTTNKGGKVSFGGSKGEKIAGQVWKPAKRSDVKASDLQAVQVLAKAAGVDVVFYKSDSIDGMYQGANGFYHNGTIYLDVHAKASTTVQESAILLTAAHELTHFIKDKANTEFETLKDFVVQKLLDEGKNFDDLVSYAMRNNKSLDYDDAVEEVVADACEAVLKDSKAVERLANEEPSLGKTIQQWLKQFFENIKKAFAGEQNLSEPAKAMVDYMDELTKLWDNAFVAAAKNNRAEVSEGISESKYSLRESQKLGFDKTADLYFSGKLKRADVLYIGEIETSSNKILKSSAPYIITGRDLDKITRNTANNRSRSAHGISEDFIRSLPQKIEDSKIFYQEVRGNIPSFSFVVLDSGTLYCIGGELNSDYEGQTVNRIKSIFEISSPEAFLTKPQKALYFTDKKIAKEILEEARVQFPGLKEILDFGESIPQSDDNVKYSFAGRKALTADSQSLSQAEKMEKQGKESEEIRQATGWFRGYDGQWRFEIDDSGMEYTSRGDINFKSTNPDYARYRELVSKAEKFMLGMSNENLTEAENKEMLQLRETWGATFQSGGKLSADANAQTKLSSYLKHEELFKAYPQLKDTRLEFKALPEKSKGSYNPKTDTITLNESLRNSPEKTLLHEIQHIIQTTEGFAKGANIENGKEQYVKSAGEIEARDTANRSNLSSEQRKNTRPDIDQTGVVVNGNGGTSYSIDPDFANEVDSWDGKSVKTFRLGSTSAALFSIGVKNRDIILRSDKLSQIFIDHPEMTKEIIKQVPEILENPMLVLSSQSKESRIVVLGTVVDEAGSPVVAILELAPTSKKGRALNLNILASAYGKDTSPAQFVRKSGLLYINPEKNRTNKWLQSLGLQLPSGTVSYGSVGSITYSGDKVKINSVPYENYMQIAKENVTYSTKVPAVKTPMQLAFEKASNKFSSQSDENIKYQLREITPLSTEDYEKTEKFFGTTTNYNVAGYLLPDGKMLDFSGKHWGDPSSTTRQVDHRDVWDVWENSDRDGIDEMVNMIGNGAIRLMPESAGINLATMPNSKQLSTLRGYINNFHGEVIVDIDQVGGDTVQSFQYSKGTSSSKILSDIQEYFKNGTVPAASSQLGSFRYQMRDNTSGMTREEISSMERSYSRLKTENAENERKWRYWKGQTELTKQQTVREGDVRKFARALAKKYDSTIDVNELVEQLQRMGNMLMQKSGEELSYTELRDMAYDIGRSIVESAEVPQLTGYDSDIADEIVSSIKAAKFKVDSYKNLPEGFRKEYKGKLHIDRQYSRSADSYYQEWQEQYGYDLFPEDIVNPDDQLVIIADALDLLTSTQMVNPFASNKNEMSIAISNEILDTMLSEEIRQTAPTKADKAAAKLAEQKATDRARLDDLRNEKNARIDKVERNEAEKRKEVRAKEKAAKWATVDKQKAADQDKLQKLRNEKNARIDEIKRNEAEKRKEVRAKEKAAKWEAVAAVREHYEQKIKESNATRRENAEARKYRERVFKSIDTLTNMAIKNTEKEHVPDAIKTPLINFLASLDTSSRRKLKDKGYTLRDQRYMDSLQELQKVLDRQQKYQKGDTQDSAVDGYLDMPAGFPESVQKLVNDIKGILDGGVDIDTVSPISYMSSEQLEDLDNVLNTLVTSIKNLNKYITDSHFASVDESARNSMDFMNKMGERTFNTRTMKFADTWIGWKNAVPYYVFKRFGTAGVERFRAIMNGWGTMAMNVQEAIDFAEKTYSTAEVKAWEETAKKIDLSDGTTATMTVAQMMSLYCLAKREQGKKHLLIGGMRIADIEIKGKNPMVQSGAYHLTNDDIATITGMLTARQLEVADELQRYLNTVCSEWGNAVSMARFGYRQFTEDNYFPIYTDDNGRPAVNPQAKETDLFRLLNMAFTKELNPNANSSAVINSIFDVFASHSADMAKYNGLALPVLDLMKWFNYSEYSARDVEDSVGNSEHQVDKVALRDSMDKAFGKEAQRYMIDFLQDLNGVREGGRNEDILKGLVGKYKAASVGANLRVALQQPTSIARAAYLLDPKYLVQGAKGMKGGITEAKKYSGLAVWKSLGYFDTNIARNMRDQIKHSESLADQLTDKSMTLAEMGDSVTWGTIWNACKLEQRAKGITDNEALMKATQERFDEIILATQVIDSTISRSDLMRGQSLAVNGITSFMSEPTMSINMLMDGIYEMDTLRRSNGLISARKQTWGKMGRSLACYVISSALTAAAAALMDVARDDDDYIPVLENWLENFWANFKDNVLPWNNIPLISDLVDLIGGDTPDSMYWQSIESMINAAEICWEWLGLKTGRVEDATSTTSYGKMTGWGVLYKALQAVSYASGVPVASATRDAKAVWNVSGGLITGKKIKFYDTGVKNSVKYALQDGYITEEKALALLYDNGGYDDPNDAYWDVQKWLHSDDSEWSMYTDLSNAIIANDTDAIDSAIAELSDHGLSSGSIESQIKSLLKTYYQKADGSSTQLVDKDTALSLLQEYTSLTKMEAKHLVDKWQCMNFYGFQYEDLEDEYVSGRITYAKAKSAMITYGHEYEHDAVEKLKKWDFEKDYGYDYDDLSNLYIAGTVDEYTAIYALTNYGELTDSEAESKVLQWSLAKDYGIKYGSSETGIKAAVVEDEISQDTAIAIMQEYDGKTYEEAEDYYYQYLFTKETGYNWSEIQDAFNDGAIDEEELATWYVHGDVATHGSEETAQEYVEVAKWKRDVDGADSITIAALEKWDAAENSLSKYGLGKEDFAKAWTARSKAEAQYDSNGKKVKEPSQVAIETIGKLDGYTSSQLTALAKSVYSSTYVNKYKTW
jgi:hypothetical protein